VNQENNLLNSLLDLELNKIKFSLDKNTLIVEQSDFINLMKLLRDNKTVPFEMLIDIVAIDYSEYKVSEWDIRKNSKSYTRGVKKKSNARVKFEDIKKFDNQPNKRFAALYHLLSLKNNTRLSVKVFCEDDENPSLPSVVDIWSCSDWFEREAYDLFGIIFLGHPDLRRILTDYGFIGHPMRKDFPLVGHVEVNYDIEKERVIYKPVSIKPRVLIPKVIREDKK
tara:strand:+ start:2932 stop:3603 length:672 start_codon:yes stop_codon:yes gene_type:complete